MRRIEMWLQGMVNGVGHITTHETWMGIVIDYGLIILKDKYKVSAIHVTSYLISSTPPFLL